MVVLLSIKPNLANDILEGTKKYEYRRRIWDCSNDVKKVILYASDPIKMVIGEFEVKEVIKGHYSQVWRKTNQGSGMTIEDFLQYFEGQNRAYAIKVKKPKRYESPIPIETFGVKPNQSFIYIKDYGNHTETN